MVKKCIYCKVQIDEECVLDVCDRCGVGVWGTKMFQAIKDNMSGAKEKGDLFQGSVSTSPDNRQRISNKPVNNAIQSLTKEALASQELYPKDDVRYDN